VNLIAATMPLKWAPGRGSSGDSTLRPTPSVTDGHAWHGDSDGPTRSALSALTDLTQ